MVSLVTNEYVLQEIWHGPIRAEVGSRRPLADVGEPRVIRSSIRLLVREVEARPPATSRACYMCFNDRCGACVSIWEVVARHNVVATGALNEKLPEFLAGETVLEQLLSHIFELEELVRVFPP